VTAPPIPVEVRRGGIVEAVHRVHAVAVRNGEVVACAGDRGRTWFMRSASKPLQALPLARARDDLEPRDLAIACASHRATPDQLAAVEALLRKAPATEDELELGFQLGRERRRLHHNCSGKHAGMLALCRARGWPSPGYRLADHPVQRACRDAHLEASGIEAAALATGIDGCGVVTYALPLELMARAFARLPGLPGARPVVDAMRGHPDLVGGPDGPDFLLMRDAPGWFAKGGAEGLVVAADPPGSGLAVALKAEDGAARALGPALAAFLATLGTTVPQLAELPIHNSRGERVGECVVAGT
jgi:L-asparaginase II